MYLGPITILFTHPTVVVFNYKAVYDAPSINIRSSTRHAICVLCFGSTDSGHDW